MKKNKKAISPLIATVLIIGFTIVLGAMVMQWGSAFFRQMTEQTGKTSQAGLACTQLDYSVDKVSKATSSTMIVVTNKVDIAIPDFLVKVVRSLGGTSDVAIKRAGNKYANWLPTGTTQQLGSFETKTFEVEFPVPQPQPVVGDTVEIAPRVKVDTEIVDCGLQFKKTVTVTS